jgi:hypothetical protein
MAGRERNFTTAVPPHKVAENFGFIEGDRGPPRLPRLRPSVREKKKEKPYLASDPASRIRRPTPS